MTTSSSSHAPCSPSRQQQQQPTAAAAQQQHAPVALAIDTTSDEHDISGSADVDDDTVTHTSPCLSAHERSQRTPPRTPPRGAELGQWQVHVLTIYTILILLCLALGSTSLTQSILSLLRAVSVDCSQQQQ
jgi:hypothetical protein